MHDSGMSYCEVNRLTGIPKATIAYHCNKRKEDEDKKPVNIKNLSEEERDACMEAYSKGETIVSLASRFNTTKRGICGEAKRRGIYEKRGSLSTEKVNKIYELIKQGKLMGEIAREVGVDSSTVSKYSKVLGVELAKPFIVSKEMANEIEMLSIAGFNAYDISDMLNISESTARKYMHKSKEHNKGISDETYDKLVDMYASGMSAKVIASRYNISYRTLLKRVKQEGIPFHGSRKEFIR